LTSTKKGGDYHMAFVGFKQKRDSAFPVWGTLLIPTKKWRFDPSKHKNTLLSKKRWKSTQHN
jgi:hypothetical protein